MSFSLSEYTNVDVDVGWGLGKGPDPTGELTALPWPPQPVKRGRFAQEGVVWEGGEGRTRGRSSMEGEGMKGEAGVKMRRG